MFGTRHSIVVMHGPRGRGYQYSCSCGATGWVSGSYTRAKQMGEKHKAAKTNGR
ncbi:hypothetical protein [Streptomyces sp. MMG1121]|uniref:hypothetical protein n=1 Tax=Streptomyces sp. MMG1121 TaxID=1415544 RepID=UPI000A6FA5BE|nr:hypothetical protein [Streptomyces sp. MMG1121]